MKNAIAIRYANSLCVTKQHHNNEKLAMALISEMLRIGFVPSKTLVDILKTLHEDELKELYTTVPDILNGILGNDVTYSPMYPNFPEQVINASDFELTMNAIAHYWSTGKWLPMYKKAVRSSEPFPYKPTQIGAITDEEFAKIFTTLVSSSDSLSEKDKSTIDWFIREFDIPAKYYPTEIPFKETASIVAACQLRGGKDISSLITSASDVLRIVTALSDGDVSLASNTKFKSLPRSMRKTLVKLLERVINEEDINRHRNKWIKLFHSLHVGDYSQKVYVIAKKVRENKKIVTFNSSVQRAIDSNDIHKAVSLLQTRPGMFGRKICHLLRECVDRDQTSHVLNAFTEIVDCITTRNLLQLFGHLVHGDPTQPRIAFPKGKMTKAVEIRTANNVLISPAVIDRLAYSIIKNELETRFAKMRDLGKVWVDPALKDCPLPSQQRSASAGMFQVARGTKLPMKQYCNTIRMFVYWEGKDIDLCASVYDDNLLLKEVVDYTDLNSSEYGICHSGDIVDAPKGASEFIDIDISKAVSQGARYVAMSVYVYCGGTFAEHSTVYVGWMARNKPQSNEIYEPKTVEQKIDLINDVRQILPVIFDLKERKIIWVDMVTNQLNDSVPNNSHSRARRVSTVVTAKAVLDNRGKTSLFDLFNMHGTSRGTLVQTKEEADTVFSINEGVGPYNIHTINSEYIVD